MTKNSMTLVNQVYEQIEYDILDGKIPAGTPISEADISEKLGVNVVTAREVMDLLCDDHLVESDNAGYLVRGITAKDVRDIFQIKLKIEVIAAKEAAENITDEELERLRMIIKKQDEFADKGDVEMVRDLDTEFHQILYKASRSIVYEAVLNLMHYKIMKYRKKSLNDEKRLHEAVQEHKDVLEALESRDPDAVEITMLKHMKDAYDNMMRGREL